MWPAILGAVVPGLINAVFGDSHKPQQTKTVTTVKENYSFNRLRKAAEKAGFNPLTVLRATGGGIGSTQTSVGTIPGVSRQAQIAGAVADGVGAFFSYDPMQTQSDMLDIKLKEQSLALGSQELMRGDSWSGSPVTAGGGWSAPAISMLPNNWSTDYMINPSVLASGEPSAQMVEDMYGDAVGGIWGTSQFVKDVAQGGRKWLGSRMGWPDNWGIPRIGEIAPIQPALSGWNSPGGFDTGERW